MSKALVCTSGVMLMSDERKLPEIREAMDAEELPELQEDASDPDAKLDVELDESFPTSDAPSQTRPGSGDPAPSSGFDEAAERRLQEEKAKSSDTES